MSCVEIKTQRAQGKKRPIRISKSHFGTDQDLIISAEHRILCPQINGSYGGRFLKAKGLCNGTKNDSVAAGFVDCVQIRIATEHVIFANGIAVQYHMGSADLESETSAKLQWAVQSASHPAKPSRRALFLPSGLSHKNVDKSLSRKRAHTFNVMQDFLPSASSQPIRGSC